MQPVGEQCPNPEANRGLYHRFEQKMHHFAQPLFVINNQDLFHLRGNAMGRQFRPAAAFCTRSIANSCLNTVSGLDSLLRIVHMCPSKPAFADILRW